MPEMAFPLLISILFPIRNVFFLDFRRKSLKRGKTLVTVRNLCYNDKRKSSPYIPEDQAQEFLHGGLNRHSTMEAFLHASVFGKLFLLRRSFLESKGNYVRKVI